MGGNTGPKLSALLSDGASDTGTLHLALGVDDDAGVVLEVEEVTLTSADGLALSDDDGGHDLLSEFWLTLLDRAEEHIADGARWQAGKTWADTGDGKHIQVLSTGVIGAVHNGCDGQTVRDLQLDAGTRSTSLCAHIDRLC